MPGLPLLTDAFKGTVLEWGLILQLVVSGRRLNRLLHCFFNVIEDYWDMLGFLDKESDDLSREGEGTNIT